MRFRTLALTAVAVAFAAPVHAAEVRVLSTNALKTAIEELAPQFEKATENKVVITQHPRRSRRQLPKPVRTALYEEGCSKCRHAATLSTHQTVLLPQKWLAGAQR